MKDLKRRIFSAIVALCMVTTMFPISAFATEDSELPVETEPLVLEENLQQNSTEDKIQSNGETGTDSPHILSETEIAYPVEGGNIYFDTATGTITDCDEEVTEAVIPEKIEEVSVTSIGAEAFRNCNSLISVDIPDSVTNIGYSVFEDCDSLASVTIGNGVTSIGSDAFASCTSLTSVTIPDSVTSIGNNAFSNCTSLTSVTIPNSVTSIGESAFSGCDSLTGVTIPDSVTSIEDMAFYRCESLTSVTIPGSVTSIGNSAFSFCDSLTSVTIKDGVTSTGTWAFSHCDNLTSVTISDSVTSIDGGAFYGCGNLTSVTIPDSVTSIGKDAFYFCESLTRITIPDSVTSIGQFAFSDCDSLTDVYYGGSKAEWAAISIGTFNEDLTSATIHYNSTGPDDPGIETSIGSVEFFSKWDSDKKQAYFDYSVLAHSVTDNTEISPNQSIDQLVGKYVLVKMSESNPLEISSIKPVDSKIGTVTNVIEGNGNTSVTSLQLEDGTYAVVNGLIVSEGIIGKQVLYHLSSEEIVGYTELQKKTGTLEEWDNDSKQLVIDGVTYFTNYITDESLFTSVEQLVGQRVEILCLEGLTASYIFQIAEAKEDYHIKIYASTPNFSTNIDDTIDITCSLYRDDKLVENWIEPAFVIGNEKVISISDYTRKDGSYYFTVTGLSEGRSSLTVSDSYSGAYISFDISVGKSVSKAYSYRMNDIPSFVPNVYGESVLTNFYNINDLYVNNFSYTKTSDGGYDVSFNVYNKGYMYGSVDVYDKDGKWIKSEKIDKFSDISSIWDTGEAMYYLIADSIDGRLLSYTSGVLSKETPVSVHVPKDGYLTISNNFSESPGVFLYNTVDYLMLSINTIVDVSVNEVQTSQIADDIIDKAIEDIDFQEWFMDKFNEIALNVSQTSLEFGFGEAAKAITVDAEDLLDSIGLNWKASAESVVGELESVFSVLTGPVGIVLDGCFAFTSLTSYVVQTNDICYSTNAPSILIHVPDSTSNTTTVQGVTVTAGDDVIDSEAVLQVFRISDTDAIEIVGGKIPVEDYRLYNICFVKNEKEVQPNGKVTVKIPIPNEYDKNRCVIYRQESDGSWAILQAVVEGNYLVFETNHFSLYAIADASTVSSISVTGVELNTSEIKLNQVEDVYQLKANILPINATNKSATWVSSNPGVATVDNTGLVTALSNGSTTITVKTIDGGFTANCTVVVNIKSTSSSSGGSSGGGSVMSTSYTISSQSSTGGNVTISDKNASRGKIITLNVTPNEGYKLDVLTVSDKNGDFVELTQKSDLEYTFVMPSSNVTINAKFVEIVVDTDQIILLPFYDISENAWYYDAVKYIYKNNMMQGISDTEFAPNLSMNRAMIVTVLHRLENTPVTTGTNQFSDVESNQWYTEAVQWAFENDIVKVIAVISLLLKAVTRI
ncbi:hypothetical protein B5E58_12055 [Tyzzerella sp. An114]|uniref:leucine-rich repeat protein n=1 Tax=Tyzzerella sp. An114 TaxID=1965545 RepID=UPI000B44EF91|nr:leucine-rich repeat protein [Tyzzerella sp. An114]OUQ55598.1 hypothetical protein B5E58_12055 [Tyzzerella sp. An114]